MGKEFDEKILKKFENCGRIYKKIYLDEEEDRKKNRDKLEKYYLEGLKFFFSRSFMRGRSDTLSGMYCRATIKVLEKDNSLFWPWNLGYSTGNVQLDKSKRNYNVDKARTKNGRDISELLQGRIETEINQDGGKRKVNKKDIYHIISTLKFISEHGKQGSSIVGISLDYINRNDIKGLYKDIDEILFVSKKIASFWIRDLMLLYDRDINKLSPEEKELTQPVDTWIRQIANTYGIQERDIVASIVESCERANLNPGLVNAGMWLIGSNSDIFARICDNIGFDDFRKYKHGELSKLKKKMQEGIK